MARKGNKSTGKTKNKNEEKKDIYIDEEIVELNQQQIQGEKEIIAEDKEDGSQIETEEQKQASEEISSEQVSEDVQAEIDAAIKEYNGEVQDDKEETQIRVRDKADVAAFGKQNKKLVLIMCSVLAAIVISLVAIGIVNKMNTNVYRNVYLEDKNLSGMTAYELSDYLKKEQNRISKNTLAVFQDGEKILEIVPADIDLEIDISSVQEKIFGFGRNSNILKNNFDVLGALVIKKEFDYEYKYNVAKLSDIVKEIKESLNSKVIEDAFVVDEKEYKLIITKGKSGNTINEAKVKKSIISSLANGTNKYTLDIEIAAPTPLDIDVVYSKVKREASDAYIDKSTEIYKFVPHKVGLDFSKDDLKNVLSKPENAQEGKVIEYKLTVVQPKVKTSDINWDLFEYKISSYTTYFSTSDANRVNNLRVALNLLNGKVIMPGETFSYNSVVGAATTAQGFKAAATFVGGRVVREVGGGICQTVSTLYNTALLANMQIVQRKAHSLPVAYVPGSRDATVYYPSIDFKFKNTREYPVKIVTSFNKNGNLTISLYGTKQENEYVVSISSKTLSSIAYKTQYINDNTMEKGKQQVIQNGSNGYTSESYITKKLNGKVVSSTLLSKDTYKAVNKIVKVGTKEVVKPPVTPEPEENTGGGGTSTPSTESNNNQSGSATTQTPSQNTPAE